MTQTQQVPECFGREWDQRAAECVGGLDPDFTDAMGSHIRRQCRFFEACGTRTQAARLAPQSVAPPMPQALVPLAHLTKRPLGPVVPVVTPSVQQAPQQQPALATPALQQLMQSMHQLSQAVGTRPGTAQPAVQFIPVNFQIPNYLTEPEPILPGEPIWKPLLRELLRSGLKALGHALAAFVDRVPITQPRPQGE